MPITMGPNGNNLPMWFSVKIKGIFQYFNVYETYNSHKRELSKFRYCKSSMLHFLILLRLYKIIYDTKLPKFCKF